MTPERKPPFNVQVLQRWVGELAREQGVAPGRIQRWTSFMVVAAMLDHARDENEDPVFVLKGGAAMELRLGLRARATKDYDTAYREAIEGMLDRLDASLRHGFGDFTATRTEPEPIPETGTQRLDIKLSYRGRSWGTVQLEVAAAEGEAGREIDRVPGKPLDALGIDAPVDVPQVISRWGEPRHPAGGPGRRTPEPLGASQRPEVHANDKRSFPRRAGVRTEAAVMASSRLLSGRSRTSSGRRTVLVSDREVSRRSELRATGR